MGKKTRQGTKQMSEVLGNDELRSPRHRRRKMERLIKKLLKQKNTDAND